ncbi:hypothetical protein B7Z28_01850, partial [Candidatus Saccharibacteria bacterium 32-45-3]
MNNKKSSIDGFVPRRANSEMGERHVVNGAYNAAPARKELRTEDDLQQVNHIGQARPDRELGRADITDSLNSIDDPNKQHAKRKLSRKEKRRLKKEGRTKGQRIRRRIVFGTLITAAVAIIGIGGFLFIKGLQASGNVLQGNFLDIIQHEPLKEDENGRSNFLIVGTSEDDPGHQGGNLTDSIMIMSIDQDKKDAYMFSIPRDLYVDYGM